MEKILKFKTLWAWTMVIGLAFMTISCQKEDDMLDGDPSDSESVEIFSSSASADNAAELEIALSYLAQDVIAAPTNGRVASTPFQPCVVVTRDTVNKVLTIDFGTGCTGPDGRVRKGKVIITFGGDLVGRLSRRVITFDNYFVNDVQYTGEIEVRNAVRNGVGHIVSQRILKDFTLTFPDGNKLVTNGQMTRIWAEGIGDGDPTTNKVWLTGKKTGRSTKGRGYNMEIIEPIVLDFTCKASGGFLRVSGIVEMTFGVPSNNGARMVRRVDYGDGTCDREYTVTINGVSKVITKED